MKNLEGVPMHEENHNIEITYFDNDAVRMNYLRELYAKTHQKGEYDPSHPDVFRTPGGFALEYATGALTWEQITGFVKNNPDTLVCCMDERDMDLSGNGVASHEGCGAAGLVANGARENGRNNDMYRRLVEALGENEVNAVLDAIDNGASTDEMGILWAKKLADAVNEPYRHLKVDHSEHYATMTIADAAGILEGDTSGKVGERAFMVSNTEFLGNDDLESAFNLLAQYTALSIKIAWGGHSVIDKNRPYTVTVTIRDEQDKQRFEDAWKQNSMDLDASKIEIHFVTADELAA
jgi:hypothetical protein